MKIKKIYKEILTLGMIPFLLSGCKSTDCGIIDTHVHKYVGKTNKGTIENYYLSERDNLYENHADIFEVDSNYVHYHKDPEIILITADEIAFYKIKDQLFRGKENWDYLYNLMASKHDYIEYEYRYRDSDGDSHHSWTDDPSDSRLTGDVRVYHFRYFGYKIEKINGRYQKKRSPLVDDIRDIINEYPYFDLQCFKEVHKDYSFDSKIVSSLTLNDVDEYQSPNLYDRELPENIK